METQPMLLVAEDDPDDQLLIQNAIDNACPPAIETCFVWDGVELVALLKKQAAGRSQPDLIVLDLNMPRKDGREALREIKTDPTLANIPVAVLTTSTNDRDAQYCQQYGVIGYFRKPGSMAELREILGKLCSDYIT